MNESEKFERVGRSANGKGMFSKRFACERFGRRAAERIFDHGVVWCSEI